VNGCQLVVRTLFGSPVFLPFPLPFFPPPPFSFLVGRAATTHAPPLTQQGGEKTSLFSPFFLPQLRTDAAKQERGTPFLFSFLFSFTLPLSFFSLAGSHATRFSRYGKGTPAAGCCRFFFFPPPPFSPFPPLLSPSIEQVGTNGYAEGCSHKSPLSPGLRFQFSFFPPS